MDVYLTQNGARIGPFRVFQIKEMLDRGEAATTDLGWHPGLDEWRPLHEIDALIPYLPRTTPPPLPRTNADGTPAAADSPDGARGREGVRVSKWRLFWSRALPRFLARCFDSMLFFALVCGVSTIAGDWPASEFAFRSLSFPKFLFMPAQALGWVFVEAWMLARFGTTPGKWLFNLRVVSVAGGGSPFYRQALKRGFFVWLCAWGIGIAEWALFGSLISLMLYLQNGRMVWDYLVRTDVHHGPARPAGWFAFGAFIMIYWSAKGLAFLTQPLPDTLPPEVRVRVEEARSRWREIQNPPPPNPH